MNFECAGVELLDLGDAALAGEQSFPECLRIRAKGADGAQARDDDAPRHFFSNSFMM